VGSLVRVGKRKHCERRPYWGAPDNTTPAAREQPGGLLRRRGPGAQTTARPGPKLKPKLQRAKFPARGLGRPLEAAPRVGRVADGCGRNGCLIVTSTLCQAESTDYIVSVT